MKKLLLIYMSVLLILVPTFSFSEEKDSIRLGGLTGPTAMGFSGIIGSHHSGSIEYDFTLCGSADEITPLFIKNEVDIISVPVNLGAVLYNKLDGDVTMLAVNTLGVLYILEKGTNTISSVSDLKGKTVFATGKGSTPEFIIRALLKMNGMDPDSEVDLIFKSEPAEIVAGMIEMEKAVCMLPQPYVLSALTKLGDTHIALDITEEWAKISNTSLITSAVFARKSFCDAHPETVIRFMNDLRSSVEYVNLYPDLAAKIIGGLGIVPESIAEKAIPFCHIVFLTGNEMRECTEDWLNILLIDRPASVGGYLPGDDFYYLAYEK